MPPPKISDIKITAIQADLEEGKLSQRAIANKHDVSQGIVSNIKKEHTVASNKSDPTDKRVLQLESKVLALRDDRNRLKKAYEAAQRKNSVFEALVDELETAVTPIAPLPKVTRLTGTKSRIRESLVLHLSDLHADEIVLPEQVGGLERFDFNIALRRGEVLVDSTLQFTQKVLQNYNFHTLYILANGDNVSGEIHGAADHSYYRNTFKNCLAVGQLQALMIRDLARHFPAIKIIHTSGNHGRRSIKKDYNNPKNNWDYLVAEVSRLHCQDLDNVDFSIPNTFNVNMEIEGHGFNVSHGDDIRSWNGIPWYGIERKTRRLMALNASTDRKISYFCFGHFHTPASQAVLSGETLINGTWVATSPYAYNSLSSYVVPTQLIHGVHRTHGVSWRLYVKLRSEREHLGPTRYSVLLAKD